MYEYDLRWIISDKSGQKDENTERQKDNTQDSEGFHPNFNELRWTNMNKYELQKINWDKKTNRKKFRNIRRWKDDGNDSENIQTISNELLRSKKGGMEKGGGSIIRIFLPIELNDLWSKKICRPKMIVWSPVLHSS